MPTEPLYPAYLPTRPDGFAATPNVAAFEGDEPGLRAHSAKSTILGPGTTAENITPRIGTEIRGVQLSQLSKAGLDEVALLAAERGVLVFVGRFRRCLVWSAIELTIIARETRTLQMSASTSS